MNSVGAFLLLSLLAVLPTHSTSINSPELLSIDKLDPHLDWHKVRRLWINSGNLHSEPEIFSYIQFLEKFEQIGQTENISLAENSSLPYLTANPVSSSISINQTTSKNYPHLLAGIGVRAFCNNLVSKQRTCGKLQECSEQNETESRVNQWCHNIAEGVETKPFAMEVVAFLDSMSYPGAMSQNANLTSNSSNIFIEWSLENPEMGILFEVTTFKVSYCQLKTPTEWSCCGGWKELTVEAKDGVLKTTIGHLEANKKYKLAVVSLFKNEMQASEKKYKYVRTKNDNSNASVVASHGLCVTFGALLLVFFYS